jgi:SRP-independent targeting protein 2/TMEM208
MFTAFVRTNDCIYAYAVAFQLTNASPLVFSAKQATAKIYLPFLLVSNSFYVLLLLGRHFPYHSFWSIGSMLLTWGIQIYAYWGILDQAASHQTATVKSKALVGGANLDLLALTIAVQYLTVFSSTRWFCMLLGVPVYAGWTLYETLRGGGGESSNGGGLFGTTGSSSRANKSPSPGYDEDDNDLKQEKRAQKRRQRRFT